MTDEVFSSLETKFFPPPLLEATPWLLEVSLLDSGSDMLVSFKF